MIVPASFKVDDAEKQPKITKRNAALALVDGRGLAEFWGHRVAEALIIASSERATAQVLGDGPRWLAAINELEQSGPGPWWGDRAAPLFCDDTTESETSRAGASVLADVAASGLTTAITNALTTARSERVKQLLLELSPWRKGPFEVLGVHLDAEWRCDHKWARVMNAVPVAGKTVLDVGCGNGYYLLRALGAGAKAALGVDPTWLYVAQFAALRRLVAPLVGNTLEHRASHAPASQAPTPEFPAWVLPLGLEDLRAPELPQADVVFSMGVLYHRKSPIEHLEALRPLLRDCGTLVLETLVVPGDVQTVLVPDDRYAAMRNVWMIPSVDAACGWLRRCGYRDVVVADVTATTEAEQRATEFMTSASLRDFLDPADPGRTIEGYPAPCRALFVARR